MIGQPRDILDGQFLADFLIMTMKMILAVLVI